MVSHTPKSRRLAAKSAALNAYLSNSKAGTPSSKTLERKARKRRRPTL